ncbi:MAG TPA: hypothetical protein VJV79_06465 [Polyangiaceae bacterium]|nr:hypothetical protein [Polyangiaceae bacterium]
MVRGQYFLGIVRWAVVGALSTGCGGAAVSGPAAGGDSSAGGTAAGGTAAGGDATAAGGTAAGGTAQGGTAPHSARQASCKVGGVVYPSGTNRIVDPRDNCNQCQCGDGQLGCTQKACAGSQVLCPSGTRYGAQCVQCGPTDACQIFEHACLPTCTDACTNGFCSDGFCRQGFCG